MLFLMIDLPAVLMPDGVLIDGWCVVVVLLWYVFIWFVVGIWRPGVFIFVIAFVFGDFGVFEGEGVGFGFVVE